MHPIAEVVMVLLVQMELAAKPAAPSDVAWTARTAANANWIVREQRARVIQIVRTRSIARFDCSSAENCTPDCANTANCDFNCQNVTDTCTAICNNNSTCGVDCTNAK